MSILDILGIAAVFLAVLYIGYRATKKTKTTEDFLMAGHSLGKIQAGFSMAATDIGGNAVVGAVAYAYACGLGGAWYNWGAVVPMFLLALFLARQLRSISVSSVPELLGRRYNGAVRFISVIAQLLAIGATLGIQFTVAASAVSTISGMNYTLALFLSVTVVVAYTIGGGLLAVVNTDVFQFIIICAAILLIIPCSLSAVGGFGALQSLVPDSYFDITSQGFLVPLSLGLLYMFDYATNQHILQRIFAAKDSSTARFAFSFSSAMYLIFGLAVAFIGVLAYALYPNLENTSTVYAMIIKDILPPGISGIALGGLFAAAMSTADSKIMATSQLFINDIYMPHFRKGEGMNDKHVLTISRVVTLGICVMGIGVSLVSESIVQMMYVGGLFYGTAVFVPMILGIYWKRGTASAALAAMISAAAVGLCSEYFLAGQAGGLLGMPSNLLATIVSVAVFLSVSLVTPPPSAQQLEIIAESAQSN